MARTLPRRYVVMAEEHGTDWPRGVQKMPVLSVNQSLCTVAPYVRTPLDTWSLGSCLLDNTRRRARLSSSKDWVAIEILNEQMARLRTFACVHARARARTCMPMHFVALHKLQFMYFLLKNKKEEWTNEFYLAFTAIFKHEIRGTKNTTIKYKNKIKNAKRKQNKIIIESIKVI